MAYIDLESLPEGSRPVELFKVQTNAGSILLCNLDVDVTYNGDTYKASAVRRSGLTDSYDLEDGKMTLWADINSELGALFKTELPAFMPTILVTRGHLVDGSLALELDNAIMIFNGRMSSPSYSGTEVKIECISLALSLATVGLRRKFSGNCPHTPIPRQLRGSASGIYPVRNRDGYQWGSG